MILKVTAKALVEVGSFKSTRIKCCIMYTYWKADFFVCAAIILYGSSVVIVGDARCSRLVCTIIKGHAAKRLINVDFKL